MAAIGPISNVSPPIAPTTSIGAGKSNQPAGKSNFADMLNDYVSGVDGKQQDAGLAIRNLVSGNSPDILPAVSAVADADMSFKLLVGVRNKVIEAYKQTLNMQI